MFFGFCFSACCFVLNHNMKYCSFASCFLGVAVFFCCFGVLLVFEFWLPSKNISQILGNSENPQMKNAEKNGHFDKNSWHRCVHK